MRPCADRISGADASRHPHPFSRSGRVRNRFEGLGVVMLEQGDRAIGVAIDAYIDQIAMFLQFIALQDLLQREKAIAFRGVEQLAADPLDPPAAAPADEGKVEVLVPAFPFGTFALARLPAMGSRQMVEREYEIFLPCQVEPIDRFTNGQAIDPAARLDEFLQLLGAHRRDTKALLLLERDEAF